MKLSSYGTCIQIQLTSSFLRNRFANALCRLQEETARVEQHLLHSNFSTAIVASYTSPELSQSTFEQMLEPLQKVVRLSPPIAASLADPEIFTRTVQKLAHKDPVARVNLLRILRTICDAREEDCTLIKRFGVYDTILHLKKPRPCDPSSANGR